MRIRLYSIHDKLLGVFLAPFPGRGDIEAIRQIEGTLSAPKAEQSPLVTSPGDYELCHIATLEDTTGEIFPEDSQGRKAPRVVAQVSQLLEAVRGRDTSA